MKIKRNDNVTVIAGKDKGKTGKVLRVFPDDQKIVVEGINLMAKHIRARSAGQKGQKTYIPARLNVAKVMVVCSHCNKPTRIGYRLLGPEAKENKERMCKKCKSPITA